MNRVYFQPIGDNMTKYKKCLDLPISVEDLKPLVDDETYRVLQNNLSHKSFQLWGIVDGKNQRTKKLFNKIQENDYIIFSSHYTIWSAGKIIAKVESEAIGKKYLKDTKYKNIYFLVDKKNIDEPTAKVCDQLKLQTPKINAEYIIRRFDGLGLSKNEEINRIDNIDNPKIVEFLQNFKSKDSVDFKNLIPPTHEKKAKLNLTPKPKTKVEKPKVVKPITKEESKSNQKLPNPMHNAKMFTADDDFTNSDDFIGSGVETVKLTQNSSFEKQTMNTQTNDKTPTPIKEFRTNSHSSQQEIKKEPIDKAIVKELKEDSVEKTTVKVKTEKEQPISQASYQTSMLNNPGVIKIRPISNLSKKERQDVAKNLQKKLDDQTTFADKYYVLPDGMVVMIPSTKKEIKALKKYVKQIR